MTLIKTGVNLRGNTGKTIIIPRSACSCKVASRNMMFGYRLEVDFYN